MKPLNLLLAILILSISSYSYAGENMGQFIQGKGNTNVQGQELTGEEQESLLFMREEEKLARDVYLTLDQYFEINIFSNIATAEQKHMDSIKRLLVKYELTEIDPIVDDTIGVYTNPVFSEFYNSKTGIDVTINLNKSVESRFLVQAIDSTALHR